MGCSRRVEYPLNFFLTQCTGNLILIPPSKTIVQFVVCPQQSLCHCQVDNSRFTSPSNKPLKTHGEEISKQGVWDFQMYSSSHKAGKEAAITFLLLPGMFYFQRSKTIHFKLENGGVTCKQSAGNVAIKGGSSFTLCLFQYEQ